MTSHRHDPSNPTSDHTQADEGALNHNADRSVESVAEERLDDQARGLINLLNENVLNGGSRSTIDSQDRMISNIQAGSPEGSPSPIGSISPVDSASQVASTAKLDSAGGAPTRPAVSALNQIRGNDEASHRNIELLCSASTANKRRSSNQANVDALSIAADDVKALFRIGEISLFTLDDAKRAAEGSDQNVERVDSTGLKDSNEKSDCGDGNDRVEKIDPVDRDDSEVAIDRVESAGCDDFAGQTDCVDDTVVEATCDESEIVETTRDESEIADARMIPFSEGIFGKDELNLAEFPISLLCEHAPVGQNTMEFHDQVRDSSRNRNVVRKLTVTASEKYGLPTVKDDDVILCLIQLSKEALACNRRTIRFSPSQILQMLGWPDKGQNYKRVALALHRWLSVSLHYENSWWDKATQDWTTRAFHVIESFEIGSHKGGRGPAVRAGIFTWSETVFQSFQAGYIKRLDFYNYLKLRLPTSKRMYRFLDKRFYHGPEWDFDLRQFAHEHIGLSRSYTDNGKLKEKLNPAIEELTEAGFIEPLKPSERYTKVGRSAWRIRFSQRFEVKSKSNRVKVEGDRSIYSAPDSSSLGEIGRGPAADSGQTSSDQKTESRRGSSSELSRGLSSELSGGLSSEIRDGLSSESSVAPLLSSRDSKQETSGAMSSEIRDGLSSESSVAPLLSSSDLNQGTSGGLSSESCGGLNSESSVAPLLSSRDSKQETSGALISEIRDGLSSESSVAPPLSSSDLKQETSYGLSSESSVAPPLSSRDLRPAAKHQTKARFTPQPSRKAMRHERNNVDSRGSNESLRSAAFEKKSDSEAQSRMSSAAASAQAQRVEIGVLAKKLIDRGISESTARNLEATVPAERIEKQIEAFDYLVQRQDKKISRSPAGYLVKAIQMDYAPPARFETAEAREKRLAEAERIRLEAERKLTESVKKRHSEWDSQVEAYWNALSPERQKEVETAAFAATNGVFLKHYEKQQAAIRAGEIRGELTLDYGKAILTGYIEKLIEDEEKAKKMKGKRQ